MPSVDVIPPPQLPTAGPISSLGKRGGQDVESQHSALTTASSWQDSWWSSREEQDSAQTAGEMSDSSSSLATLSQAEPEHCQEQQSAIVEKQDNSEGKERAATDEAVAPPSSRSESQPTTKLQPSHEKAHKLWEKVEGEEVLSPMVEELTLAIATTLDNEDRLEDDDSAFELLPPNCSYD